MICQPQGPYDKASLRLEGPSEKEISRMIYFPTSARVECADGPGGRSTCVIIDPARQKVTHLVVKEKRSPHAERLVSIDQIVETTPNLIRLRCTKDKLTMLVPFAETRNIRAERPRYKDGADVSFVLPYVTLPKEVMFMAVKYERVPPGELAVRRGARVEATDGHIGRVHEFLLDPTSERITHLVLKERHLWGQRELAIPISEVERLGEETIYLKLDKHAIESLPASPVERRQD